MKTLILYVFHQDCANLDTFIRRGIIGSPDMQFIFICNNTSPNLDKWNFLDDHENVHLFVRPNIGHDFQGWNEALFLPSSSLDQKIIYSNTIQQKSSDHGPFLHTIFDHFVFVNSTVTGPYLPLYVDKNWVDCFTSKFSSEIKMVGISVNFLRGQYNQYISDIIKINYGFDSLDHAHIQSMIFSLDREGIDILFRYGLFREGKNFPKNKWELICSSEIGMSSILRHEKKSLYSFLFNQGLVKHNEVIASDDPWCTPGLHPVCETIFSKVTYMHNPEEQARYDSVIPRDILNNTK